MAFPASPVNNQTVTVNGILYTYNSTKTAWSVTTNASVNYNVNSLTAAAAVTAATIGIGTVSPTALLDVSGSARFGALNSQTVPVANSNGGVFTTWNYSSGGGETDFWNQYSPASQSFNFNQITGTGTFTQLASFQSSKISLSGIPGSESLRVTPVTSAVNYMQITGSVTGAGPYLSSQGSDTNISFTAISKGTADVQLVAQGTGSVASYTNGSLRQFNVAHVASAVNYLQVTGAATGLAPTLSAQGSDTNVSMVFSTKGAYGYGFYSGSFASQQFAIGAIVSAVNYLQVTGSATGVATTLSAQGSDTNISLALIPKGTGGLSVTTGGGQQFFVASTASAVNYIQVAGNVTTAAPVVSAKGSDTNIDLLLVPKGTGTVIVSGTSAIKIPVGTTAQQPAGASGFIRMNTTTNNPEWWDATTSTWLQFSQPAGYSVNYLVVAGGGGGGITYGGGGGGGGVLASSVNLSSGTAYTITVGAGGAASVSNAAGSNGGNSAINAIVTSLGGGGGGSNGGSGSAGSAGGSGGGGTDNGVNSATFGVGTSGQGNSGAPGISSGGGGGGGGAGAAGSLRNGGNGVSNSISGASVYYGGGGGGFSTGTGGLGGGGAYGGTGTINSGGGGGANNGSNNAGGSGIVIIAYLGSQRGTGGTVTSSGGYTIHTFTANSTYNA